MGYPSQFIDRLKPIFSITQLCPLNGSSILGTIDEAQPVRQGCPLSIHLFRINLEPLLVRLSNTVAGYSLNGEGIRVRAYVDDLVVFVSSHIDILRACKTIEEFCAGTKANPGTRRRAGVGLRYQQYYCKRVWFVCTKLKARLAQSVEHETLNLRVVGSSPTLGVKSRMWSLFLFSCHCHVEGSFTRPRPDSRDSCYHA